MIFVAENSNKLQKTRFSKDKLVEDVVTLGPMAHAIVIHMVIIHQTLGSFSYELNKQVRC
jgi:hypothetical protein